MRAEIIEQKLEEVIEFSSSEVLTDFVSLVKDCYLTGRGDEIISPHSFLLSLTLAVYDCFNLRGSNAVPTGGMTKHQVILKAEDNAIMCRKYSMRTIVSIPHTYYETIFYSLGKEFGSECLKLFNLRRQKSLCVS